MLILRAKMGFHLKMIQSRLFLGQTHNNPLRYGVGVMNYFMQLRPILCAVTVFFALFLALPAFAAESDPQTSGLLLAQSGVADDAYDPFADYSEFEESSEEEADINFFRNGRFFTMGFIGGYRSFTENMGKVYQDDMSFGLFLSYFFDLRFALQLAFLTGSHPISFDSGSTSIRGDASFTSVGLNLKYYVNTQNVTRGLAQFNPYFVGGFAQVYRTATVDGESAFSKDGAFGFEMGGGIELPMMRNKMFFGAQATYQIVNFADENKEIIVNGNQRTGIFPTGDIINVLGILGINF